MVSRSAPSTTIITNATRTSNITLADDRTERGLAPEEEWERQQQQWPGLIDSRRRRRSIAGAIWSQWHGRRTRHRRWPGIADRAAYHDDGVRHLLLLHQIPERRSILHR